MDALLPDISKLQKPPLSRHHYLVKETLKQIGMLREQLPLLVAGYAEVLKGSGVTHDELTTSLIKPLVRSLSAASQTRLIDRRARYLMRARKAADLKRHWRSLAVA